MGQGAVRDRARSGRRDLADAGRGGKGKDPHHRIGRSGPEGLSPGDSSRLPSPVRGVGASSGEDGGPSRDRWPRPRADDVAGRSSEAPLDSNLRARPLTSFNSLANMLINVINFFDHILVDLYKIDTGVQLLADGVEGQAWPDGRVFVSEGTYNGACANATLDDVASLIRRLVERRVAPLVLAGRDHRLDPPTSQIAANPGVAIALVARQPGRSGPRPAWAGLGQADRLQRHLQGHRIVCLARCHPRRQRDAMAIDDHIELGAEAALGATQGVINRLVLHLFPPHRPPLPSGWPGSRSRRCTTNLHRSAHPRPA